MKLPRLYTFKVKQKVGEELVEREFFLRKPNRRLFEDGELFQGRMINEAITKHKLLPRALLAKTYTEYDGVYTEKEKEHYKSLITKVRDLESEYQSILLKDDDIRSEKEKERINEIAKELIYNRSLIRDYELQEDSLYDSTAESYARRKFVFWWVSFISYQVIEDKEDVVLKGNTYDEKMDHYDVLIENDRQFWQDVFAKFTYYVAIWMNPTINGDADAFEQALEILEPKKEVETEEEFIKQEEKENVENDKA